MSYTIQTRTTPNRSSRGGVAPKFFVMHVTEGAFDGAVSWLCNPKAQASADEVVSLDGSRVAVLNTPASKLKSWAVGNGNPQSMSWENEGFGGKTQWPASHYDTVAHRLVKAQAAVKRVYGVTVPLKRTTSASTPGLCEHGDMARWFGGSDHYSCPGTTFDWNELAAALVRVTSPAWTAKQLWTLARWYVGVGEFAGKARVAAVRPPGPRPFTPLVWAKVAWYAKQLKAQKPPDPIEYLQILDKDGKVLAEAPRGDGKQGELGHTFRWADHARADGPLAVRMVKK